MFVVGLDGHAAEVLLKGGPEWQRVVLSAADFGNAAGETMDDWTGIKALRLGAMEHLQQEVDEEQKVLELGAAWNGADPEFRNLRWMK